MGGAAIDFIEGRLGPDTVFGGAGDDRIHGGRSDTFLDNAGNRLSGGDGNDLVGGATGDDYIEGNAGSDYMWGYDGADTLVGGADRDTLIGQRGADTFVFNVSPGSLNFDSIHDFESGVDKIELDARVMSALGASGTFSVGDERFYAAFGATGGHDADDRLIYDMRDGSLYYDPDGSGSAAALVIANLLVPRASPDVSSPAHLAASDIVVVNAAPGTSSNGTSGADSLVGTAADDTLQGFAGNDTLNGLGGNDRLAGGEGDDSLIGGGGADTLVGGPGTDTLDGGSGDDWYFGLDAGERIIDAGGHDSIVATATFSLAAEGLFEDLYLDAAAGAANGTGNNAVNYIAGNADQNMLSGMGGADTLFGGAGDDTLLGGAGDDELTGGEGIDVLDGGLGRDYLAGAWSEKDIFVFSAAPGEANADVIALFDRGWDEVHLDAAVMPALGPSGEFGFNDVRFYAAAGATSGHDADDRVVYDTSTARLYYDADGSGSGAAQLIAITPNFGPSDITVINGGSAGLAINGTSGNDTLDGTGGDDTINGLAGNDEIRALPGDDLVDGGEGNDWIWAQEGDDVLIGGAGNDELIGEHGSDTVRGGDGDDLVWIWTADLEHDSIDGGAGADTVNFNRLVHFSGVVIDLGAGTVTGGGQAGAGSASLTNVENILATQHEDRIVGSAAGNVLDGYDANDTLEGLGGDDTLYGSYSDDLLMGGVGNDVLDGGYETDTLTGGAGADDFAFTIWPQEADAITDFASGLDELRFQKRLRFFTRIGASTFSAGDRRFHAAAGATVGQDADDRVIYNTTTGEVYYGRRTAPGLRRRDSFARLGSGATLAASDIGVDNGIPDQGIDRGG